MCFAAAEIVLLQALKVLDVVNYNLRFLPTMTTMTPIVLNIPYNVIPQGAPDGTTRMHFRVPLLREVVLWNLLTSSPNPQRLLAPTGMTSMVACVRQFTTFQLPLQDGALTPSNADLLTRLAPAAVSVPRRCAFWHATTSGPGAALFSPSMFGVRISAMVKYHFLIRSTRVA